jgi:hypothetical protein
VAINNGADFNLEGYQRQKLTKLPAVRDRLILEYSRIIFLEFVGQQCSWPPVGTRSTGLTSFHGQIRKKREKQDQIRIGILVFLITKRMM